MLLLRIINNNNYHYNYPSPSTSPMGSYFDYVDDYSPSYNFHSTGNGLWVVIGFSGDEPSPQPYTEVVLSPLGDGVPLRSKPGGLYGAESPHNLRDFSLSGMYSHFQFGGKKDMYIRGSSFNFSNTSQRQLGIAGWAVGHRDEVNLFNAGWNDQIALAFGRVDMVYLGNNQFNIVGGTRFDFIPFWESNASLGRNIGNVTGLAVNYNLFTMSPLYIGLPLIFGGPYNVHIVGSVYIPY